jgi:hypothetical protein
VQGTGLSPFFLGVWFPDSDGVSHYFDLGTGVVDVGVLWVYRVTVDPGSGAIAGQLIPPTTTDMSSDVGGYLASGGIDNRGIGNSLKKKLDASGQALSRGQTKAAANILNAFINEVEAQGGKHISIPAANNLIFHARYILDNME